MKPEDSKKIVKSRKPPKKRRRFERPRCRLNERSHDRLPHPTRNAQGDYVDRHASNSDYEEFVDAREYPPSPCDSLTDANEQRCVDFKLQGQFFVASIYKAGNETIADRVQIPAADLEKQGVQLSFRMNSRGVQRMKVSVGKNTIYHEMGTRLLQAGDSVNVPVSLAVRNSVGVQTLVVLGANDITETDDITQSFNREICVESDFADDNPGQFYTVASGEIVESSGGSGGNSSEKLQQTSMISSLPTDESIKSENIQSGNGGSNLRLTESKSDPVLHLNERTSNEDSQGTQIPLKQSVISSYQSSSEEISEYVAQSRLSRPMTGVFSSSLGDDDVNSYGQIERPMTTASDAVKSMHLALKPITDQINDIKNRMICMNIHPLKSEPIASRGQEPVVDERNAISFPTESRVSRRSFKINKQAPSTVEQDLFTTHRHFEPIHIFDHQSIVFNPFPLSSRKCVWSEPDDIFLLR